MHVQSGIACAIIWSVHFVHVCVSEVQRIHVYVYGTLTLEIRHSLDDESNKLQRSADRIAATAAATCWFV